MVLIFDTELGGHHLEYIHHLWMGIASTASSNDEEYVFAVPEKDWMKSSVLLDWPECKKITLRLLSEDELSIKSSFPIFKRAVRECKILQNIVNKWGGK